MSPWQVSFSSEMSPPTNLFIYVGVSYGICLIISGSILDAIFTCGRLPLGFAFPQPFRAYQWQGYLHPGDGMMPKWGMHQVPAPSYVSSRRNLMLLSELSPAIPISWWGIQLGARKNWLIPPHSLHVEEGSSFPALVPPNDTVDPESVVDMKSGDSGVVIGYQVDEFTHTWSAECFVAQSHIYPSFMGKVSSLTHFPLEPGWGDYSFLYQAMADFEQGLDFILSDSIETLELDISFEKPYGVPSSVSPGLLCLVSTISATSKLQHAPSIKSYKVCCQARVLLLPVTVVCK